ncbi:MAG: CoA transferase [Pseudomonadales bacterium]|nr:CoA transferase [Pseudomonadales bacterium]
MSDEYLFSGLKVLDVGTWIAGPVAATILADFGADVIKVEIPGDGDQYRAISALPGFPDADSNYMWQMDGRNKRSLALNLKTPEGMAVLHKLIAECDVYVTNHPYPMREALGLCYEDIRAIKPDVIYASLTAYGEQGPDRNREGFDLVAYWARTGLMDLVRDPSGSPAQAIPGMGDHPSAVTLYAGIVTALLKKERTGEGSFVHTSLLANGLWSASCIAQAGFAGGSYDSYREVKASTRFGTSLYRTLDNRWLQFNMVREEKDLIRLFETMGLGDLIRDDRFSTPEARAEHGDELVHIVRDVIAIHTSDEWLARFAAAGVNGNRVGIVEETVNDEMIYLNKMVVAPVDGSTEMPWVINHPIKVSNVPQIGPTRAPDVGENSADILAELGYSEEQIAELRSKHVI